MPLQSSPASRPGRLAPIDWMRGLVMVLMMIWRPQGLLPAARPKLQLPEHAEATR